MANKTFNTRVKNKRDTAANWEAVATTFQPLDGELIIVDTSAGKTRFKVGRYDTAKGRLLYYNEIPFADEYLYNDLNESQGKIYDKLKGIDDKSIIEMTLESVFDNTKFVNYRIGLWQFPKTGFYKLNIAKRGTTVTQLFLYAQKTKEDGTTPEDPFSQDNLLRIFPLTGDKQVESVFVQVDYTDTDTLTVYKVQFLNVMTFPGTININTYNKTTQKWDFTSVTESSAKWANNATQVSNALTLTKGDTTTKFDGSTAQTVSIPTKTSELTNDSNFTTQTDLDNLTNTVVSYNAQENITDEQKAQARTNIGAISEADLVQPDWNQNDETAKDYIKNRICYEEMGEDKTYTLVPQDGSWNFTNGSIPLALGQTAIVKSIGGSSATFTGTVTQDSDGKLCIDATSVIPITIYSNTATYVGQWISNADINSVVVMISSTVVHQINPKYIPNIDKQTLTNGDMTLTCDTNIIHDNHSFQIRYAKNEEARLTLNENSIALLTHPYSTGPGQSTIIFDNGIISSAYKKVLQDGQYSLTNTSFNINASSDLNITSNSDISIKAGYNNVLASNISIQGNEFAIYNDNNSVTATLNGKEIATKEYVDAHVPTVTIDSELSPTSTNAIQNKAVKTTIDTLQASIDSKIDTTTLNYGLTQVTNDIAANYVKFTAEQTLTDEQKAQARENINAPAPADAVYTVTASSTDGVAYAATVPGIDSLTVGASFIMIPDKVSTSKAPTLNVNGLGAKPIRRRLSSLATSLQQGYSTNWIALNKPFTVVYDGSAWIVEGLTKTDGADVYGAVAQATADANGNNIADTYATIAMLQSMLPKVTTITLTSNWVGDASPYYQDIALSCATETSIVDLQPTPEQLNSWQDEGLAFTTLSGNGTVRVYVAGGKPSSAISVQVRVQEVTVI